MKVLASVLFLATLASAVQVPRGKVDISDTNVLKFSSLAPVTPFTTRDVSFVDSLSVSFSITADDGEAPFVPQLTALSIYPKGAAGDFLSVVKVRKNGRATWRLDPKKLPQELKTLANATATPLTLELILGDPSFASELRIELGSVRFDTALTPAEVKAPTRYEIQDEIHWTFQQPQKQTGVVKAGAGFIVVVGVPWIVASALLGGLDISLSGNNLSTVFPFLISLGALESLIVLLWFGVFNLKLLYTLPYMLILSAISALAGRNALNAIQADRLKHKKKDL